MNSSLKSKVLVAVMSGGTLLAAQTLAAAPAHAGVVGSLKSAAKSVGGAAKTVGHAVAKGGKEVAKVAVTTGKLAAKLPPVDVAIKAGRVARVLVFKSKY